MIQVKIFSAIGKPDIEYDINDFLESVSPERLIDIKFTETPEGYSALLIYK